MSLKVLVAHGDERMRDQLQSSLRSHRDIHVLAAVGDGREAVDKAIQLNPDVVVTSVSIPVMNGIDAARAIVETRPDIAVLMLSGNAPPSTIAQAFRAGARGYLLEAFASADLVKAVRMVASGGRYLGSGVVDRMLDSFQAVRSDLVAVSRLSAMEREILRLAAEGKSNVEMAEILNLSPRTVETYRAALTHKLGLADVASLVKFAIRLGIIPLE